MSEIKIILIVANSGRMLAQYASNIGYTPLVIDCFCDHDTQLLALDCKLVRFLALDLVKQAFQELSRQYSISHFIYGSGFERHQECLAYLQKNLTVYGNRLEVFSAIQDKACFFLKLKQLGILFPETSFSTPNLKNGWLVKPMLGEGGLGVKKYQYALEETDCYWQKYLDGTTMSVLFVANESSYEVIGFNKQFFSKIGNKEFVFSGVSSQPEISEKISKIVVHWLDLVVSEFKIKGINSLDFIVNEGNCYLLEINARPSASMQLYDSNLISEHIHGCQGLDLSGIPVFKKHRAYHVCFAETDVLIDEQIKWPVWVVDIPQQGSLINTGMPICSIIACGKNDQQVAENLLKRQQILKKLLKRYL